MAGTVRSTPTTGRFRLPPEHLTLERARVGTVARESGLELGCVAAGGAMKVKTQVKAGSVLHGRWDGNYSDGKAPG